MTEKAVGALLKSDAT